MMDDARKQRLLDNLAMLPRRISAWMMGAGAAVGTLWYYLPKDQQLVLLQHSPLPVWIYPIVLSATGIASSVWPRKNRVSPDEAAAPA